MQKHATMTVACSRRDCGSFSPSNEICPNLSSLALWSFLRENCRLCKTLSSLNWDREALTPLIFAKCSAKRYFWTSDWEGDFHLSSEQVLWKYLKHKGRCWEEMRKGREIAKVLATCFRFFATCNQFHQNHLGSKRTPPGPFVARPAQRSAVNERYEITKQKSMTFQCIDKYSKIPIDLWCIGSGLSLWVQWSAFKMYCKHYTLCLFLVYINIINIHILSAQSYILSACDILSASFSSFLRGGPDIYPSGIPLPSQRMWLLL